MCAIQYALSFVEHYVHEGPENYYGLLIMSVPFLVQISHALALLSTNHLLQKALKQLIFCKNPNSQVFVTAVGNTKSKPARVNASKPRTVTTITPI